jgi:hypothetical protein
MAKSSRLKNVMMEICNLAMGVVPLVQLKIFTPVRMRKVQSQPAAIRAAMVMCMGKKSATMAIRSQEMAAAAIAQLRQVIFVLVDRQLKQAHALVFVGMVSRCTVRSVTMVTT